ncbi:YheC/YheD family protein [Fontibacillus phaseoli]|uniref:YheC/YheD family protein n=1 Tax=Fontibacillus phaseoli TaxID=1416533 RepID=UPI001FE5574A|nr:YheC/YheD family protein [Fontibacillus phaseoli]
MAIQRIASKWEKTIILRQKELIRAYIPETRKYTFEHLKEMIDIHGLVYVKPDRGTYGNGVMSIEPWCDELEPESPVQYKLRFGIQSELYPALEELHAAVSERIDKKFYLIQKGITLLTFRRRKFDIRALVQKTPQKTWETTGFIGRVAAQQKIITNYHGGGSVMPIEELLSPYLEAKEYLQLYKEMKQVGILAAAQLTRKFPNLKEIGLDIAIDEQFKIWILEVNTLPALFPFKKLQNKDIYKKIHRYAVAYGRLKK